jgi:Uma2 family endonuclease
VTTIELAVEQRNFLRDVDWQTYVALSDTTDRAGCRLTYDRGDLEIMTPSMPHERYGTMIGRMVERYSEIFDIEIRSVASTTFRRADMHRGFEADEAYYVQNAERIRGISQVDLEIHPPPDLVVEIEISRSAIDKMSLFAAMGIPELWRYNRQSLEVFCLENKTYASAATSEVFPGFPLKYAEHLLGLQLTSNETTLIRQFARHCESL